MKHSHNYRKSPLERQSESLVLKLRYEMTLLRFAALGLFVLVLFAAQALPAEPVLNVMNSQEETENVYFQEDTPLVTPDGNYMLFNSSRPTSSYETTVHSHDYYEKCKRYDYDMYLCRKTEDGWSSPERLPYPFNSVEDESFLWLSPDGRTVYYLSYKYGYEYDGGPVYKAEFVDGALQSPVGLGGGVSVFLCSNVYKEYNYKDRSSFSQYFMGATFSPDGKTMVFSTDLTTSGLSTELFVSHMVDGKWSTPENLSAHLNNNGSKLFPTFSPDGNKLYFSSDAEGGKGGYDLYYANYFNGKWSEAKNMEYLNTKGDEFQLMHHLRQGMAWKVESNNSGKDVADCKLVSDKYVLPSVVKVNCNLTNLYSGRKETADLKVYLSDDMTLLAEGNTDSESSYSVALASGFSYYFEVLQDDEVVYVETVNLESNLGGREYNMEFQLTNQEMLAGVNSVENEMQLKLMPNPVSDVAKLELMSPVNTEVVVELVDLNGNVLKSVTLRVSANGYNTLALNVSSYTAGVYVVNVIYGGMVKSLKLVKK